MGFSSSLCEGCHHSLRSSASVGPKTNWMTFVVSVSKSGVGVQGAYDGYGHIIQGGDTNEVRHLGIGDYRIPQDATVYHRRCWLLLGKTGYIKKRRRADDQGFFVSTQPAEPRTLKDLAALRAEAHAEEQRGEPPLDAYLARKKRH